MLLLRMSSLILLCALCGCSAPTPAPPCAQRTVRLATTTSVDNTGLLKALLPPFRARTGISVRVISVGTGQALKLGERGDVDLVWVHDPLAEQRFIDQGFGLRRQPVMHNDFVLVGPRSDRAKIRGGGITAALQKIAAQDAPFISRGDRSGTHKAELRLWRAAGVTTRPPWYLESGLGQRLNLNMAHQKQAYCLVDRATFLYSRKKVQLQILVEGDPALHNPYSVIPVNPARHPHIKHVEAMALLGWVTSPEGQRLIGEHRQGDAILFHPDVIPARP